MRCQRAVRAALMFAMLVGVQPAIAAPRSQPLPQSAPAVLIPVLPSIQTVFLIMMENHNWSSIHGSPSAPYINSLLPLGAHAEYYYNPPAIHPSEPNYLWLEAGTNFGILDDAEPAVNHQSTTQHLSTLLTNAGVSWKTYQESIDGASCPLTTGGTDGKYGARHNPFVYFDDVTNTNDPASATCIAHNRPYAELATDLANNTVARYNFITPNVCDDMHDSAGCATLDSIENGDTWLSHNVPTILNSAAYRNNGALFITWDEGEGGSDGPIGMIALSPLAKQGYVSSVVYSHSSTLRTYEEIFGVTPLLGDAAHATDLSDFFHAPIPPPLPPRQPTGQLDPSPVIPLPPKQPSAVPNGGSPPNPLPNPRP